MTDHEHSILTRAFSADFANAFTAVDQNIVRMVLRAAELKLQGDAIWPEFLAMAVLALQALLPILADLRDDMADEDRRRGIARTQTVDGWGIYSEEHAEIAQRWRTMDGACELLRQTVAAA